MEQKECQKVRDFAEEVEDAVKCIKGKHPDRIDKLLMEKMMRNVFYRGLKRVYRESYGHLYDNGAPYHLIKRTALTLEKALANLERARKAVKKDEWGWARAGLEPEWWCM